MVLLQVRLNKDKELSLFKPKDFVHVALVIGLYPFLHTARYVWTIVNLHLQPVHVRIRLAVLENLALHLLNARDYWLHHLMMLLQWQH